LTSVHNSAIDEWLFAWGIAFLSSAELPGIAWNMSVGRNCTVLKITQI